MESGNILTCKDIMAYIHRTTTRATGIYFMQLTRDTPTLKTPPKKQICWIMIR